MVYGITYHDDETMQKVYKALHDAGVDEKQATDAVMRMQNAGILFRETSTDKTVKFGGTEEPAQFEKMRILDSPITEEAMRDFWERETFPPLRNNPDENPFKKLADEREAAQDDPSLD